jgi:LAO/AO transport system kinase
VLTVSGLTNAGLPDLWDRIRQHRDRLTAAGVFQARRSDQAVRWMAALLDEALMQALRAEPKVAARLPALEIAVRRAEMTPQAAVSEVMALFRP